jgi:hypothetical protein
MADGVEFTDIKDDARYEPRTSSVIRERRYTFYIDKHGPFVARVPLDPFDENAIHVEVAKLRAQLANLPK